MGMAIDTLELTPGDCRSTPPAARACTTLTTKQCKRRIAVDRSYDVIATSAILGSSRDALPCRLPSSEYTP